MNDKGITPKSKFRVDGRVTEITEYRSLEHTSVVLEQKGGGTTKLDIPCGLALNLNIGDTVVAQVTVMPDMDLESESVDELVEEGNATSDTPDEATNPAGNNEDE